MITYPNCALLLEVIGCWCAGGVVHDHRGLTSLDYMYWDPIRTAESEDLWLAAPHRGVPNVRAVARILPRANDPRVSHVDAVFALHAREERHKVLRVHQHIFCRGSARGEVVCLLWRNDVEDSKLVCDCREETMAVWVDLLEFEQRAVMSTIIGNGVRGGGAVRTYLVHLEP